MNCPQCPSEFTCNEHFAVHIIRHQGTNEFSRPCCPLKFETKSGATQQTRADWSYQVADEDWSYHK